MNADTFIPTHWMKLPNTKYLGICFCREEKEYIYHCVYENLQEKCGWIVKSELHYDTSGTAYFRKFNRNLYIKDFQLGFTV